MSELLKGKSVRNILAVDGNSIFHRAYHGYSEKNKQAQTNWAVEGFFYLLGSILERVKPDIIIVGFDDKESLRKAQYPQYKAGRAPKEPEAEIQLAKVIDLLDKLGVRVIIPSGLEADDVSASVADSAYQNGDHCVIATSDRDSFALVKKNVDVLRIVNGGIENAVLVTEANMRAVTGVGAGQYLDYAAMRGDSSDNLPGVAGFGEKSAAKLMSVFPNAGWAYESLRNGKEEVAELLGKSLAEKLRAGENDFNFTRAMMKAQRVDVGPLMLGIPKHSANHIRKTLEEAQVHASRKLVERLANTNATEEGVQADPVVEIREEKAFEPRRAEDENDSGAVTKTGALVASSSPGGEPSKGIEFIPNPRPERSLLLT